MAEQEIVTRYRAIIDEYRKDIDVLIEKNKQLSTAEKKQADDSVKNATTLKTASQQRKKLLDDEIANLKKLEVASKQAFTVKDISAYNSQINESQKRISLLKGETGSLNSVTGTLKGQFLQLGAGILAAFSVGAVLNFAKEAVNAFIAAEENANKLAFAVKNIANESENVFTNLIAQSKELQNITIFSDDDIQRAQTALLTFGLTGEQVEKLIPKLVNLASATGKSLAEITSAFTSGIEGQTRALKDFGLKFEDTGSRVENLNLLLEKLNGFEGAAAEAAATLSGQLQQNKNRADELAESIGSKLAPAYVKAKLAVFGFINELLDSRQAALDAQGFTQQQIDLLQAVGFAANSGGKQIKEEGLAVVQLAEQLTTAQKSLQAGTTSQKEFNELITILIKQTKESNVSFETQQLLLGLINNSLRQTGQFYDNLSKKQKGNVDVTKLSNEELKKALEINKALNSLEARDLVSKIEEELKKRDKLQKKSDEDRIKQAEETRKALLAEEQKTQDGINKLRLELAPEVSTTLNQKTKSEIEFEINLASLKKVEKDTRSLAQIQIDIDEKKNQAILLNAEKLINDEKIIDQKRIDEVRKSAEEEVKARNEVRVKAADTGLKEVTDNLKETFIAEEDLREEQNRARLALFREGSIKQLEEKKVILKEQAEIDIAAAKDNAEKIKAIRQKLANELAAIDKQEHDIRIARLFEILSLTDQIFSSIIDIQNNATQKKIDSLEQQKEVSNDALDKEEDALQASRNQKLISEKEFEERSAALKLKRIDSEKKLNAAINAEKRKQAELDRALKIFEIAIQTAENAVRVFPLTVPPGLLIPLAIALGALQTAAVLSAPLPKFALGTKFKQDSGMAIVGEEGQEAVFLPRGSQVLSAKKTKMHRELIDAIHDNRIEDFISQKYLAPVLMEAKAKQEIEIQTNIANSFMLQKTTIGGIDEYGMMRVMGKERKHNKSYAEYLAKKIADELDILINFRN